MRCFVHEVAEEQRGAHATVEGGIGKKVRAEQRQGDAHGTNEQVFPGGFQRAGILVEVEQRRRTERAGLDGHPHEAEVLRLDRQGQHGKKHEQAGREDAIGLIRARNQIAARIHRAEKEEQAEESKHHLVERIEPEPGAFSGGRLAEQGGTGDGDMDGPAERQQPRAFEVGADGKGQSAQEQWNQNLYQQHGRLLLECAQVRRIQRGEFASDVVEDDAHDEDADEQSSSTPISTMKGMACRSVRPMM
jgi:hypothetical protein